MKTVKYNGECYDLSKDIVKGDPFLLVGLASFSMIVTVIAIIATVLVFAFAREYTYVPVLLGIGVVLVVGVMSRPTSDIPGHIKKYGTKVECPDMDKMNACLKDYESKNCKDLYRCMEKTNRGWNGCIKDNPCKSHEVCNYKGIYEEI